MPRICSTTTARSSRRGEPRHGLRVARGHGAARQVHTLEAFGRVLHGVQDFYSHSNWADEADPTRPSAPTTRRA